MPVFSSMHFKTLIQTSLKNPGAHERNWFRSSPGTPSLQAGKMLIQKLNSILIQPSVKIKEHCKRDKIR